MVGLACIGEDGDGVGVKVLRPVEHGGQIGGGVIRRAIGLADDKRLGLEARVFGMKNHQRAL